MTKWLRVDRWFLSDRFILSLILINVVVIFLEGFNFSSENELLIEIADHILTTLFVVEVLVKWSAYSIRGYFRSNWNVFDFVLVVIAIPSLLFFFLPYTVDGLQYVLILRVLRIFKFFRFIRFIPNIEHLASGAWRAVKASVLIIIVFAIFNVIVAVLTSFLFRSFAPEYFGNPLISLYNIFKIFTVEGWYEIPDAICEDIESELAVFSIRIYFVIILVGGGIFGLSLVNSIFVDSMLADNNDDLSHKVDELTQKIDLLIQREEGSSGLKGNE